MAKREIIIKDRVPEGAWHLTVPSETGLQFTAAKAAATTCSPPCVSFAWPAGRKVVLGGWRIYIIIPKAIRLSTAPAAASGVGLSAQNGAAVDGR